MPDALGDMTTDVDDGPSLELTVAPTLRPPPRRYDPRKRSSSPRVGRGGLRHGSDEAVFPLPQGTQGLHMQSGGGTFGNTGMVAHGEAHAPPLHLDQANPTG